MIRLFFLIMIVFLHLFVACNQKEPRYKSTTDSINLHRNSNLNSQLNTTNNPLPENTSHMRLGSPLDFSVLTSIFPSKIELFTLHKINKGQINHSGKKINTVSGEYISNSGNVIVSCFDYLRFPLLPDHLKNFYDPSLTKNDPDIFFIGNDIVGSFYLDNLTKTIFCNIVYKRRFYIKIEGYGSSFLNEDLIKIATSLLLNRLDYKQGTK